MRYVFVLSNRLGSDRRSLSLTLTLSVTLMAAPSWRAVPGKMDISL